MIKHVNFKISADKNCQIQAYPALHDIAMSFIHVTNHYIHWDFRYVKNCGTDCEELNDE